MAGLAGWIERGVLSMQSDLQNFTLRDDFLQVQENFSGQLASLKNEFEQKSETSRSDLANAKTVTSQMRCQKIC